MEWVPTVALVVFISGILIVAGTAIYNAYKD